MQAPHISNTAGKRLPAKMISCPLTVPDMLRIYVKSARSISGSGSLQ